MLQRPPENVLKRKTKLTKAQENRGLKKGSAFNAVAEEVDIHTIKKIARSRADLYCRADLFFAFIILIGTVFCMVGKPDLPPLQQGTTWKYCADVE